MIFSYKYKISYNFNYMKNILVFGSRGSIANHIYTSFQKEGHNVFGTTTNKDKITEKLLFVTNNDMNNLLSLPYIDVIVWGQGHNFNDNISTFNNTNFTTMLEGNVTFILNTLNYLLKNNKIATVFFVSFFFFFFQPIS